MPQRRGGMVLPALLTLVGLVVLIGLGLWQLERRAAKHELTAKLAERLSGPPAPLPPRAGWDKLDKAQQEYRRVTFPAEFEHEREALVYAAASAFRPDVSGPGYWVFTPARLPGGSVVVVNRGFVPDGRQDPKSRPEGQATGIVDLTGVMRWPEPRGSFTPADAASRNLWFLRDHQAIAEQKGWGPVAPFYIEQEAPAVPGGLPKAGRLQVNLPDNHLQYAITWFSLAGALLVVFIMWMRARRREPLG
jgi:surfeit locus 1 family protein